MVRHRLEHQLNHLWYGRQRWYRLLLPAAGLFCTLVRLRAWLYRTGVLPTNKYPVPVIVVGNLTAGGSGKTPLVIWLAEFLRNQHYTPGIVASGYPARPARSQVVNRDSDPERVGDESVLLARRTGCPVVAGKNRSESVRRLLAAGCDLILSDDGLQHYRLERDVEIAVIDGQRQFGNGHCLPAGPLREPVSRIESVDLRVGRHGSGLAEWSMLTRCNSVYALSDPDRTDTLTRFAGQSVNALAGIAHPEGFFDCLRQAGLDVHGRVFPDHYTFTPADLDFGNTKPVLMTEKDAVKCSKFAPENCWVVPLDVELESGFAEAVMHCLP